MSAWRTTQQSSNSLGDFLSKKTRSPTKKYCCQTCESKWSSLEIGPPPPPMRGWKTLWCTGEKRVCPTAGHNKPSWTCWCQANVHQPKWRGLCYNRTTRIYTRFACSRVQLDWMFSSGTPELLMDALLGPVSWFSYVEMKTQAATEPWSNGYGFLLWLFFEHGKAVLKIKL